MELVPQCSFCGLVLVSLGHTARSPRAGQCALLLSSTPPGQIKRDEGWLSGRPLVQILAAEMATTLDVSNGRG